MPPTPETYATAPIETARGQVRPEWIDYNGHMNVAYYVLAFDHGTDYFLGLLGMDPGYPQREGGSTFALEMHVSYERELKCDQPYVVRTQLIDADTKRIHLFHRMHHANEGWLAATNEVITMHIDMAQRRSAPFPQHIQPRVEALKAAHTALARPEGLGRVIGIRRSGSPA
ncbi:MAG: thioesterase family protein [Rhodocyclaceae bacterium]|jgi:acyl-CoA thioester hydrolase|nr:thioesterase family protein [Rhodocyclaceae bacterium]MCL4757827.1 thioesterase family protein [Rhodocyclaceae bacterium]